MDERQWLRHPDTGGAFNCPTDAVDEWAAMGWVPGEAPTEPNPVAGEHLAWRAEQAAAAQAADEKQPDIKPKSARRGEHLGEVNG